MRAIGIIIKVIAVVVGSLVLTAAVLFCIFLVVTYRERNEITISGPIREEIESMYKEVVDVKANAVGMKKENGTMVSVAVTIYFKTQNGRRAVHAWHMHPIDLLEGSISETNGEE